MIFLGGVGLSLALKFCSVFSGLHISDLKSFIVIIFVLLCVICPFFLWLFLRIFPFNSLFSNLIMMFHFVFFFLWLSHWGFVLGSENLELWSNLEKFQPLFLNFLPSSLDSTFYYSCLESGCLCIWMVTVTVLCLSEKWKAWTRHLLIRFTLATLEPWVFSPCYPITYSGI